LQANQTLHRDHPPPTYRMSRLPSVSSIIS